MKSRLFGRINFIEQSTLQFLQQSGSLSKPQTLSLNHIVGFVQMLVWGKHYLSSSFRFVLFSFSEGKEGLNQSLHFCKASSMLKLKHIPTLKQKAL